MIDGLIRPSVALRFGANNGSAEKQARQRAIIEKWDAAHPKNRSSFFGQFLGDAAMFFGTAVGLSSVAGLASSAISTTPSLGAVDYSIGSASLSSTSIGSGQSLSIYGADALAGTGFSPLGVSASNGVMAGSALAGSSTWMPSPGGILDAVGKVDSTLKTAAKLSGAAVMPRMAAQGGSGSLPFSQGAPLPSRQNGVADFSKPGAGVMGSSQLSGYFLPFALILGAAVFSKLKGGGG